MLALPFSRLAREKPVAEIRMMATTGMIGYGYTEEAFRRGLDQGLDFIAADGGSMDPGPHYLGEGIPFVSRAAIKRDLSLMLEAAIEDIAIVDGNIINSMVSPKTSSMRVKPFLDIVSYYNYTLLLTICQL